MQKIKENMSKTLEVLGISVNCDLDSPRRQMDSDERCGIPPSKRLFRSRETGPITLRESPGASVRNNGSIHVATVIHFNFVCR